MNDEYGFLAFATDHGLFKDCESYGNGDSGIYPGSASDLNGDNDSHDVERFAVEITGPHCSKPDSASGSSGRWLGEPTKVAKLYVCSGYSAGGPGDGDANLPAGCDWFGGGGLERLEAQLAGIFAGIAAVIGLLVWFRRFRESQFAGAAMLLGFAGLGTLVWGATSDYSMMRNVVGFVLVGIWFVITGLSLLGQRWLYALLTTLMGVFAFAAAYDRSVAMIPWLKLGPTWILGILGLIWMVWSLFVIFSRKKGDEESPVIDETPDAEPEPAPEKAEPTEAAEPAKA